MWLHPEEWAETAELIEQSALRRVQGVGVGRRVSAIDVELLALEFRELGSFGWLRAATQPTEMVEVALDNPLFKVQDQGGNEYFSALAGGDVVSSPGHPTVARLRFLFSPAVEDHVQVIRIQVVRFGSSEASGLRTVTGPWDFEVALT
jgi:hypothetical protein